MTLADSSAWIEFLRKSGDPLVKGRVASLLDAEAAAYCGPIQFEVMARARASETEDIDM